MNLSVYFTNTELAELLREFFRPKMLKVLRKYLDLKKKEQTNWAF
jgi:hypothetical protein